MALKKYTFRPAHPASDPILVEIDPGADSESIEGFEGHFYQVDAYLTLPDLLQLVEVLRKHECPDITAQQWASASRGGKLEEGWNPDGD